MFCGLADTNLVKRNLVYCISEAYSQSPQLLSTPGSFNAAAAVCTGERLLCAVDQRVPGIIAAAQFSGK